MRKIYFCFMCIFLCFFILGESQDVFIEDAPCLIAGSESITLVCNTRGASHLQWWNQSDILVSRNAVVQPDFVGIVSLNCLPNDPLEPPQCNLTLPASRQFTDGTWRCEEFGVSDTINIALYDQTEVNFDSEENEDSETVSLTCTANCVFPHVSFSWNVTDGQNNINFNPVNTPGTDDCTAAGQSSLTSTVELGREHNGRKVTCTVTQSSDCLVNITKEFEVSFTPVSDPGLSPGEIIGMVIGILAGLGIIISIGIVVYKKTRPREDPKPDY